MDKHPVIQTALKLAKAIQKEKEQDLLEAHMLISACNQIIERETKLDYARICATNTRNNC